MAKDGVIVLREFLYSIKALFTGFLTVFSHLFKKPVTEEYPEEKPVLNKNFRGKHSLSNCRGCGYCQKVCPTDAITIVKTENLLDKYFIDLGKCIFCGNCQYYCPTHSMKMTEEFALSTVDRGELIMEIKNTES